MRTDVRPEQMALQICECGSLHLGACEIDYARYGVGSLDRHAARPRRARVPHRCDCAYTSPAAGMDHELRRCGLVVSSGEIYVEMPRYYMTGEKNLPAWTLTLEHAVMYHSDLVRIGLDPDARIGTLQEPSETAA